MSTFLDRHGGKVFGGLLAGLAFSGFGRQKEVDTSGLAAANRYAADRQYEAQMANIAAFERAQAQARADMAPWRHAGLEALGRLNNMMREGGFEMPEFQAPEVGGEGEIDDPGYRFRRREGEKHLERRLRAGGVDGGAKHRALLRFNSDLASQEYAAAHSRAVTKYGLDRNRLTDRYNRLAGLANTGQTVTQNIIDTDRAYTSDIANANTLGANAQGQGAIGAANADIMGQISRNNARQQNWNNLLSVASLGVGGYVGYQDAMRP